MHLAEPYDDNPKTERLQARATRRQKEKIQQAADLKGQSITEFMLSHLEKVADETISAAHIIRLNEEDSRAVVDALLNPPEPTPTMLRAVERYKQRYLAP